MYRAGLESILGFQLRGDRLKIDPCVPRWWREFEIVYRRGRTTYRIKVENPLAVHRGVITLEIDGALQTLAEIFLTDDGQTHSVRVVLGEKPAETPERQETVNEMKGRAGRNQ
jgi:cyclic beta-1,2-glucan synthetase